MTSAVGTAKKPQRMPASRLLLGAMQRGFRFFTAHFCSRSPIFILRWWNSSEILYPTQKTKKKENMSKRVLCKFFARRTCLKGENCDFSHDWQDSPNNICTFYQKGICAYGSRCRYEHVRISQLESSAPSSSMLARQNVLSGSDPIPATFGIGPGITAEHMNSSIPVYCPKKPGRNQKPGHQDLLNDGKNEKLKSLNPADQSICSLAAAGNCPRGEKCPHIHGDLCSSCGKHCLHPFRPHEREEHIKKCEKLQKHLEALKHSQEIDCSVCLEHVLSKPTAAERKFGILSECDHPFCISCIRNWRSSSPSSGFDVNSALRACPICRKLSYFVIPSVIWYSTKEEKQEIVTSYKTKLRSIDCKHFDFGTGTCPFGSSCFYKHAYRDGRLEEAVLRQLGYEDGTTMIVKNIRLSEILSNLQIR